MYKNLTAAVKQLIDRGLANIKEKDGKHILCIGGKNSCCRKHWADDKLYEIDVDGNVIGKIEK